MFRVRVERVRKGFEWLGLSVRARVRVERILDVFLLKLYTNYSNSDCRVLELLGEFGSTIRALHIGGVLHIITLQRYLEDILPI